MNNKRGKYHWRFIDITGQRFGRLTAKEYDFRPNYKSAWICQCDCGNAARVETWALRAGSTISCGCYKSEFQKTVLSEQMRKKCTVHGDACHGYYAPEYQAWQSIKARCYNPKDPGFKNYGGRGIKMSEQWRSSYAKFLADMGRRPTPKHSIDRIDNDGDYTAENCRWATKIEQCNNTRKTVYAVIDGVRKPRAVWARELGLSLWKFKALLEKRAGNPEPLRAYRAKRGAAK